MKIALENGFELDDDRHRIDVDAAFAYVVGESYFGHGRSREVFEATLRASMRMVGVYAASGDMVGFARAISDGHTFAYLADVYVLPAHQGRGLGTELLSMMLDGSSFAKARWMIGTRDAHGLYERFGFGQPSEKIMERPRGHCEVARSSAAEG